MTLVSLNTNIEEGEAFRIYAKLLEDLRKTSSAP